MFRSWLSTLPQSSCTIWQKLLLVIAGNAVCSKVWSRAANGCHPFLRYYCLSWVLPFPIWWWRDLLSVADIKSEGSHPSFRTWVSGLVETVGKLFLHLEFGRKLVLLTVFIWRGTIKWLLSLTAPGARGCLLSQQAILEKWILPVSQATYLCHSSKIPESSRCHFVMQRCRSLSLSHPCQTSTFYRRPWIGKKACTAIKLGESFFYCVAFDFKLPVFLAWKSTLECGMDQCTMSGFSIPRWGCQWSNVLLFSFRPKVLHYHKQMSLCSHI